jgi:hypothetical protein
MRRRHLAILGAIAVLFVALLPANASAEDEVDTGPTANADAYSTGQDVLLSVPAFEGVLINDTNAATVNLASDVSDGALSLSTNGGFIYTPNTGFNGTDSFTYTATGASGTSAPATVTITVGSGLIARADAYTVAKDSGATTLSPAVLDNDSYLEDGKTFNFVLVSEPAHGTFDETFPATYTPDPGFSGTDTFTYRIDEIGSDKKSNVATVTITVTPAEEITEPIANDDAYTVEQDSGETVLDPHPAGNDELPNAYVVRPTSQPSHGTLSTGDTYTYTPDPGFSGTDTFTYQVVDCCTEPSPKTSGTATVTITVTPTDGGEGNGAGEDDLVSIDANCSGDIEFTNISDLGLEVVYGNLPGDVDGDFVLAPEDTEKINTGRSKLEFRAEGPGDEFEEGTITLDECSTGDEDDDDDDGGKGGTLPDTGGTFSARLLLIAMLSSIGGLFLVANTRRRVG